MTYLSKELAFPVGIEAPKGDALLAKTIAAANDAMLTAYPHLQNPVYAERFVTIEQITPLPHQEIVQAEREAKPDESIHLFRMLRDIGVPKERLHPLMYVAQDNLVYCPVGILKPPVYIVKDIHNGLYDADPNKRMRLAGFLGAQLIQINLNLIPKQRELPKNPWTSHMKNGLRNHLSKGLSKLLISEGIDIAWLSEIEEEIFSELQSEATRFVAHGASTYLLFDDQTLANPEFILGPMFQTGIALSLARSAREAFALRYQNDILPASMRSNSFTQKLLMPEEEKTVRDTKDVLRAIGLPTDEGIIRAYLESEIPSEFHTAQRVFTGKRKDEKDNDLVSLYPD